MATYNMIGKLRASTAARLCGLQMSIPLLTGQVQGFFKKSKAGATSLWHDRAGACYSGKAKLGQCHCGMTQLVSKGQTHLDAGVLMLKS